MQEPECDVCNSYTQQIEYVTKMGQDGVVPLLRAYLEHLETRLWEMPENREMPLGKACQACTRLVYEAHKAVRSGLAVKPIMQSYFAHLQHFH